MNYRALPPRLATLVGLPLASLLVLAPAAADAFTLKGKLKAATDVDLTEFSIVAETGSGEILSAPLSAKGTFVLKGVQAGDRYTLLRSNNYYGPVLIAVKDGKKLFPYQKARAKSLCAGANVRGVMALRKGPTGPTKASRVLQLALDTELGLAYVKRAVTKKMIANALASLDAATCAPTGVGSAGALRAARIGRPAEGDDPQDPDADGEPNDQDVDDDDDGVPDSFDQDNDGDGTLDDTDADNNDRLENRVWNFQQLHLDVQDAYNTRVMTVTTEMIDAALVTFGGLAVQVIDGDTVELDCGGDEEGDAGLPYCISGGTGRAREPYPDGLALPDEMDADGDGKAEIQAGGSGDLQLAPGATSAEIRAGDTFIEEVTTGGTTTKYVGMINAVVHDVPGIVSIETTLATHTFAWPPDPGSIGTFANPIPVPASGDVEVTVTTYLPHYSIDEGARVVPGRIRMIANIPNGPCTPMGNGCGPSDSSPGLLPGSLYSNPSAGWEVVSDGVQSTSDADVPEGEDGTVTYTMNLAGTGGVTGWDSGEYLRVPIQSLDNNGGTAAINVWFQRE
jgi:hypothetical protein